jgi:leucyl/phenylalanyl-tRNA---protein transferase
MRKIAIRRRGKQDRDRMPSVSLDPQTLLSAYAQGVFPMAERNGAIAFFTADPRGILPLDGFHIPKTLGQLVRRDPPLYEVRINHDFAGTMRRCMEAPRGGSWINRALIDAYVRLHKMGFAHSVETWAGNEPAGGLYGVSLGAAFFGESMFHFKRDASKVALVHLVARLRDRGFELLDAQATTQHLRRFGAIDIPAEEYLARLRRALQRECRFD